MNWACDQASGVAEKVGVPGAKPGWPEELLPAIAPV